MVAYFCLEYAFDDNPDFYRGGLGVLSGDLLLQAEKDNFPLVALGLYYSHSSEFNLVRDSDHEIVKIPVEVGDHVVAVQASAKTNSCFLIQICPKILRRTAKFVSFFTIRTN